MPSIDAKPTKYRGITFRSRLEARWAIFLDLWLPRGTRWQYEPITVKLPTGWSYTPDFSYKVTTRYYLEIKPAPTALDYAKNLEAYAKILTSAELRGDLVLCIGDFYKMDIVIHTLKTGRLYSLEEFFPDSEDAALAARAYRFDLSPPKKGRRKRG